MRFNNNLKLAVFFMLFAGVVHAQADTLQVNFNKFIFQPKDTMYIGALYNTLSGKHPPATLEVVIDNEEGGSVRYRWPLLKGVAEWVLFYQTPFQKGSTILALQSNSSFFQYLAKSFR